MCISLHIFYVFAILFLLQRIYCFDHDINLVQDDPSLIAHIQKYVLQEPVSHDVPYNLSEKVDVKGQYGQAIEIEKIFKGKRWY